MTIDAEGRFLLDSLIPGVGASISFRDPVAKGSWGDAEVYRPDTLQDVVIGPGEVRDLGDILITPVVTAKVGAKAAN